MLEFVSKLEEIIPAEELLFNATPAFGKYKPILESAISHPAKMNCNLLKFLIENFTKESDIILDPMAGSGSTGVLASLHGRNAICVELEEKFVKWMNEAKEKVEKTLAPKGNITNIQGDARQLSSLLKQVDVVITSPPYMKESGHHDDHEYIKKRIEQGKISKNHPRFREKKLLSGEQKGSFSRPSYNSNNLSNIGNLPHSSIDAVITSPPYADGSKGPSRSPLWERLSQDPTSNRYGRKKHPTTGEGYGKDRDNIGNLKHGDIDVVITSPPYKTATEGGGLNKNPPKTFRGVLKNHSFKLSNNPANIDNLPYVDAVITSPPYESYLGFHDMDFMKKITEDQNKKLEIGLNRGHSKSVEAANRSFRVMAQGSLENENNIGNLKKQSYLEAMSQVYQEMYKILRIEGKAIVVIKPFIRNKKVVDLPYQTWLLLERCGFKLVKLFKLRLQQQSFWRILYQKKNPSVAQIKHEYILVTVKS